MNEANSLLTVLREIQPISHLQLVGASVAAIGSFFLPLIQLIR